MKNENEVVEEVKSLVPFSKNPNELSTNLIDSTSDKIIREGITDTELSIFGNCSFLKERLTNLTKVITKLEKDLMEDSFYDNLTGADKLKIYQIYSDIQMQMLDFLKDVHGLIADEVKFKRIQEMINETKNSISKDTPRGVSPKMRQVIDLLRTAIDK